MTNKKGLHPNECNPLFCMVGHVRLERTTIQLKVGCSTN